MAATINLKKNNILIYSDFDLTFSEVIKKLKKNIVVDLVMISRDYELEAVIQTMSIELLIVNLTSSHLDKKLLVRMMKILEIPTLFLTDKTGEIPEIKDFKKPVFSFPIDLAAESYLLVMNVKSILEFSRINEAEVTPSNSFLLDKTLCRYIMELDQKNKTISSIKSKIDKLCSDSPSLVRNKLRSISRSINLNSIQTRHWEDFSIYFEKVNPDFIRNLSTKHPNLTIKDIKYCCYLKMNMSNNDIKNLLSINQNSVRTHKYRLKKKIGLRVDESIHSYLQVERVVC